MKWYFGNLDNSINKAQFDCGIPQLNDYLNKYALQNDKKGVAKVIVAIPAQGERVVAGYYTKSAFKGTISQLAQAFDIGGFGRYG
ncbi:MAG: hypothetical protein F6K47_13945 [Symploca sp. SIO2E6]|nr:hypothetical protein [Symploca sp. SIO2E6]